MRFPLILLALILTALILTALILFGRTGWVARVRVGSTLRDRGRSPRFFRGLLDVKMLRLPSCASRRPPDGSARRLACSATARISDSCPRSVTRCRGCPGRARRGARGAQRVRRGGGGGGRGAGGGGGGGRPARAARPGAPPP